MTDFLIPDPHTYHHGLSSHFESESIPHSLPTARNSPQKPPYGLYAEKLSGSAFTAPRHLNKQTWLYRILPSASHIPFTICESPNALEAECRQIPNQLRWDPFDVDDSATFISGLRLLGSAGDIPTKNGLGIYVYTCGRSMPDTEAFYSADGDMLIVPQAGTLDVRTELGRLLVRPMEILVVPRGIRYNVALHEPRESEGARGYILETWTTGHFELPELGPIGSNGLANARDFQIPTAAYIDSTATHTIMAKFNGKLFRASQNHSPFDVVAWHGNYYPFKYDLGRFNTIGSISYDHPDPSIFTVLTVQSAVPGTAVADFVIFPPRWLVGEDTFRPPWFHRNCMSEFMGLIDGDYDAKTSGGFVPGGASLHNVMAGHGPDAGTAERASECELKPQKVGAGSMAFMFESSFMIGVSEWALAGCRKVQEEYNVESWTGVKRRFKAPGAGT
ncbi:putative homogentisate 1,2-dioxygenase [Tricharina praecox]|uniref:putative homogentisate 1,2-dioxygenase n=1 Tax=Tricharina praecox TaxID=43433 RepID=UPI0022207313|nr:putative homogentisate 1,2-dioxygenase [Tricharina praecox]KAI5842713.1 putative homogentisate 1,2-dioxygenase [Tricharina praecox]